MKKSNNIIIEDPLILSKKVFSLLGIATRGGFVASGEYLTETTVKEGRAKLVIVAGDSSNNTKKSFTNTCTYYKVPIYFFGDKISIGHAMGKEFRASLALTNAGISEKVIEYLKLIQANDTDETSINDANAPSLTDTMEEK